MYIDCIEDDYLVLTCPIYENRSLVEYEIEQESFLHP